MLVYSMIKNQSLPFSIYLLIVIYVGKIKIFYLNCYKQELHSLKVNNRKHLRCQMNSIAFLITKSILMVEVLMFTLVKRLKVIKMLRCTG